METRKLTLITLALVLISANLFSQAVSDTTFHYRDKFIKVKDSLDEVRVKVSKNDSTAYVVVYEGVFSDKQTYEKYSVESQLSFDIPLIKKTNKCSEIYSDDLKFGMVYLHNQFDFGKDGDLQINSANELYWQPVAIVQCFEKTRMAIITGLGLTWRNYHIGNNNHLAVADGVLKCETAPEGINYQFSRLRAMEVTLPLKYKWQPSELRGFHFSVGGLFGVNVFTSYKVKYRDPDTNKKIKDVLGKNYQLNPFSFSGIIQVGYEDWGVFCKYTPTSVFKKSKGPNVQTLTVGMTLNL